MGLMGLKDVFNKGLDLLTSGATAAKDAALEKKKAMDEFSLLKTRSDHIGPMSIYISNNREPQVGKEQMILKACLTINVEKSKIANKLIPVEETILDVKTSKEAKTELDYTFVLTDKRLWILNQKEYTTYTFDGVTKFEIVNKGVMTQGVNFNNMAFIIDGSENDVKKFIDNTTKTDIRNALITRSTAYLCGITPRKQLLNMNMKGITLGDDNSIVIHNGNENKLMNVKEIIGIQVLINDMVCYMKTNKDNQTYVSSPSEARKMSVKFQFQMGEYMIEIMPQSSFNTSYKREETTYITNLEFGKSIVDTLATIIKE